MIVVSVVLGRAICAACGGAGRWGAAPAVGFSALIVLTASSIKLPGRAITSSVVCAATLLVSVAILLRAARRYGRERESWWRDPVLVAVPVLGASLPFIANGRIGLQGVTLDNDSALHLLFAEAARSSRMAALWSGLQQGYPLGPHSAVATVGTATGIPLDMAFAGLLIAIIPLTALVAADVLAEESLWRRAVVAATCALCYLAAAYYGEGAFKETIMALLLLGFVVHLEQVERRWSSETAIMRWRLLLPAGLLVLGAIYTYSLYGVAWFGATLVVWGLAQGVSDPKRALRSINRRRVSSVAPWVFGTGIVGVLILLPVASSALSFVNLVGVSPASGAITTTNLGNLSNPLSGYEVLGVWLSPDFRHVVNVFEAGEFAAFALAVVAFGIVWSIRRRALLMPAAAIGAGLIWWYSQQTQSPYVAAKALVIGSPLVVALALRALLSRHRVRKTWRLAFVAAGVAYCGLALYSSYQALRSEPVGAPEAGHELAAFSRRIGDSPVLFLGVDDFAPWQLKPAAVTTLSPPTASVGQAGQRPSKPFAGLNLDFDSVAPGELDNFSYVITTTTPYSSQAPANFRLIAGSRLYELWQRAGPTPVRWVIDPSGAPGAVLNCRVSGEKALSRAGGEAATMAAPVAVATSSLAPGQSEKVALPLPPGAWELSAQIVNNESIEFAAQGHAWSLPAYMGRPGPFFRFGSVRGQGTNAPITLRIKATRRTVLVGKQLGTVISAIAATRAPDTRRIVPLRRACGQYVDWFRFGRTRR